MGAGMTNTYDITLDMPEIEHDCPLAHDENAASCAFCETVIGIDVDMACEPSYVWNDNVYHEYMVDSVDVYINGKQWHDRATPAAELPEWFPVSLRPYRSAIVDAISTELRRYEENLP